MKEAVNMRKVLVVILALCVGTLSVAYGWNGFTGDAKVDDVKKEAEGMLKNAEFREAYSYRFSTHHYILMYNGKFVGIVWSDSKDGISVGDVIPTAWGAKVMLLQNGSVIGQLFVGQHPGHHWDDCGGHGHKNGHENHCMQNWDYSSGIKS